MEIDTILHTVAKRSMAILFRGSDHYERLAGDEKLYQPVREHIRLIRYYEIWRIRPPDDQLYSIYTTHDPGYAPDTGGALRSVIRVVIVTTSKQKCFWSEISALFIVIRRIRLNHECIVLIGRIV